LDQRLAERATRPLPPASRGPTNGQETVGGACSSRQNSRCALTN
jgi:hypothetical protein